MPSAAASALAAHRAALWAGTAFALAAGLMWGLVFIAPTLLPGYPAVWLSCARYLAFGLIALPLAWLDRVHIRRLTRADWREALRLSLIGNLLYYTCLAGAIQRAGGPLPTMIIGTLPVVIAVVSNLRDHARDGQLPWARLAPGLLLIAAGIACVNQAELTALRAQTAGSAETGPDLWRYGSGALLALAAVACWTWYPLRNADWLRLHADRSPRAWATAQGVATLPLAVIGGSLFWAFSALVGDGAGAPVVGAAGAAVTGDAAGASFDLPLGPDPLRFVGLMLAIGLFASWLGTLCWNEASQRLPTSLAGQLIVFETLAALSYAYLLRGEWPGPLTFAGVALLVAGVVTALRVQPVRTAAAAQIS